MTTFTLPSATSTLAGITAYSADFFAEYLPVIYIPLGLTVVALGLLWLTRKGSGFFGKLFGGRRSRRMR